MKSEDLKKGTYAGGVLVAAALESAGITHTFGIPGTHNIELYDALERSPVRAVLVTDEQSAGFMADGVARSGGPIACANVVPGAGVTHVLSGVAEALMDGVPMLVLTCGIRTDTGHRFQLHDIDQLAVLRPLCKHVAHVERGEDLTLAILDAVEIARSGCPGPVAVEVPANLYLTRHPHDPEPVRRWLASAAARAERAGAPLDDDVRAVARMLAESRQPLLHLGLGAAEAGDLALVLAERIGAVVSTTFSGKGVFPESHPQWLWPGFGNACPAPLRRVADRCDAALIIGARMGEVSTGSFGLALPDASAQVDVEPGVLGANFPVRHAVVADARRFLAALLEQDLPPRDSFLLRAELGRAHAEVSAEQRVPSDRVSPGALFAAVQRSFPPQTRYTTDSGNGTFLAVEHLRLQRPRHLLSPTDFSCMGYAVPAAIGAAFAHGEPVVAFAGDGALLMTGLELLTAAHHKLPVAVFVLRDGELGQIASFQRTLTNAAPCAVLPDYDLEGLARMVGATFFSLRADADAARVAAEARQAARQGPVLVDVAIDYSQKTYFTRGVVKTNFGRLAWRDRLRMLGRAVSRRVLVS